MKVWIVVEHYDIGSDEFRIEGVFSTPEGAVQCLSRGFISRGWSPLPEDLWGGTRPGSVGLKYYADGDENESHAWIEEHEVDPA